MLSMMTGSLPQKVLSSNTLEMVVKQIIYCLPHRKCLKEKEENKNQALENCRKQEEFLVQLHDCLDPDKKNEKASDEDLILKVFLCRLKML